MVVPTTTHTVHHYFVRQDKLIIKRQQHHRSTSLELHQVPIFSHRSSSIYLSSIIIIIHLDTVSTNMSSSINVDTAAMMNIDNNRSQPKQQDSDNDEEMGSMDDSTVATTAVTNTTSSKTNNKSINSTNNSTNNSTSSKTKKNAAADMIAARTNMSLLHFVMKSPKYSLGLFLFLSSYTNPLQSVRTTIQQPIQRLQTLVNMEAKAYQDCIGRATIRSHENLQSIAMKDRTALDVIHVRNEKTLQRARTVSTACTTNTHKTRESLIQWKDDGMDLPWMDGNTTFMDTAPMCTAEKRNRTESLLRLDEYSVGEDEVSDAFGTFLHDSRHALAVAHQYALDRAAYDYKYFIQDRIQPILDYLANQTLVIDGMDINLAVDLSEVERKIRATLVLLQRTLEETKEQLDILQAKLKEFLDSINGFYSAYNLAFQRLKLGADFVVDLLPPGARLPPFFDLSTFPSADMFLPNTSLTWPKFHLEYDKIRLLLDGSALECLRILLEVLDETRKHATQQVQIAAREVTEYIQDLLTLEDYHPPRYQGSRVGIDTMEGEMDFQAWRGRQTLNLTLEKMADLRSHRKEVEWDGITFHGPNITSRNDTFVEGKTTQFEYLDVKFPDITIPEFVTMILGWFTANTWALEVLIHAYRLWRLETMYKRGAIPSLPVIDYGAGDDDDGANNNNNNSSSKTKYVLMGLLFQSLLSPRVILFLLFLPVAIVAIVFWFPHVQQTCVESSTGTILANQFWAPMLINRGNAVGNSQFLLSEFSCQKAQREWCTAIGGEADRRFRSDIQLLDSYQIEHNHSLDELDLFDTCLNLTTMSTMTKESCCGLKGYQTGSDCATERSNLTCPIDSTTNPPSAYRPMDSYLNDEACQEPLHEWMLQDPNYDCVSLADACHHIPCRGVNQDRIRAQTIHTDCQIQRYVIDCCYFLLTLFMHAITINLISTILFDGLREVLWRQLNPTGIRLITNLRENGDLVKGYESIERSERIRQAIRRHELKGTIKLRLGIVILIVYVSSLLFFILKS